MPATARRLLLLRHAKSDWPDGVADHDRPLAPRGRRDATAAGEWLATAGLQPDLVLVSTALRTRQTWELIQPALRETDVQVRDDVYAAAAGDLLDVLRDVPDERETVLVIGHNPGTERLARVLDDGTGPAAERARMLAKYPTCGIAVLEVPGPWGVLDPETCRLAGFAVPRG